MEHHVPLLLNSTIKPTRATTKGSPSGSAPVGTHDSQALTHEGSMGYPTSIAGLFIMENPIEMDDVGLPIF